MNDVMVDLETVGRRAGCGILSIGAVAFDPTTGQLGPEFYQVVKLESCKAAGLHEDQSTLDWWQDQSAEARKVLTIAKAGGRGTKNLADSLVAFNTYLGQQAGRRSLRVWGNGSDFDNAILYACYAAVDLQAAWEFWNSRCYRTLKNLAPSVKMERQGVYHNALADVKSQAEHALRIFKSLKAAT